MLNRGEGVDTVVLGGIIVLDDPDPESSGGGGVAIIVRGITWSGEGALERTRGEGVRIMMKVGLGRYQRVKSRRRDSQ